MRKVGDLKRKMQDYREIICKVFYNWRDIGYPSVRRQDFKYIITASQIKRKNILNFI